MSLWTRTPHVRRTRNQKTRGALENLHSVSHVPSATDHSLSEGATSVSSHQRIRYNAEYKTFSFMSLHQQIRYKAECSRAARVVTCKQPRAAFLNSRGLSLSRAGLFMQHASAPGGGGQCGPLHPMRAAARCPLCQRQLSFAIAKGW